MFEFGDSVLTQIIAILVICVPLSYWFVGFCCTLQARPSQLWIPPKTLSGPLLMICNDKHATNSATLLLSCLVNEGKHLSTIGSGWWTYSLWITENLNRILNNNFCFAPQNIQSTNWQTMRFKPPPPNSSIGWRVEFRPTEVIHWHNVLEPTCKSCPSLYVAQLQMLSVLVALSELIQYLHP